MQEKGKVIFLNGPSSVGKSTLSKKLKIILPDIFYLMAIDQYQIEIVPPKGVFLELDVHEQSKEMFYHAVELHLSKGFNLIIDDVVDSLDYYQYVGERLKGSSVFWVRLNCSLKTLLLREEKRKDREADFDNVKMQYKNIFPKEGYQIVIDSEYVSSDDNAMTIREGYYNDKI